jgi:hypothetical protein
MRLCADTEIPPERVSMRAKLFAIGNDSAGGRHSFKANAKAPRLRKPSCMRARSRAGETATARAAGHPSCSVPAAI